MPRRWTKFADLLNDPALKIRVYSTTDPDISGMTAWNLALSYAGGPEEVFEIKNHYPRNPGPRLPLFFVLRDAARVRFGFEDYFKRGHGHAWIRKVSHNRFTMDMATHRALRRVFGHRFRDLLAVAATV